MSKDKPQSVRLGDELMSALDRHIALRLVLGERVTRSDVIREALEAYLPAFESELRESALEQLSDDPT